MGDILSKKVANNTDIGIQSFRNAKYALIAGLLIGILKYRSKLIKLMKSKKKNDRIKIETTIKHFMIYCLRFPVYVILFSILFKKMMRMNLMGTNANIDFNNISFHKYSISFMAFLLAHFMEQQISLFHWKWILYLLIRSLYSLIRLNTNNYFPELYNSNQLNDWLNILHTIFWTLMGCLGIIYYSASLPYSIINTYQSIVEFDAMKFHRLTGCHHHKYLIPNCKNIIHFNSNHSCFKAYIMDSIAQIPKCSKFFIKLHLFSQILSKGTNVYKKPIKALKSVIKNTIRSNLYWIVGVFGCQRICTCFSKHILAAILNPTNNKYKTFSKENLYLNMLIVSIIGYHAIKFEPKSRGIEITLSLIWYCSMQFIRILAKLETNDNDKYHYILGSSQFTGILFGLTIAINIYVYCKNPKFLKSLEATVIHKYLMN